MAAAGKVPNMCGRCAPAAPRQGTRQARRQRRAPPQAKPHAPVEQSRRLRPERPNYDHGREPLGEAHSPVVAIKPADRGRPEYYRNRKAQASRDIEPKQCVALRRPNLRALHCRMTQPELLEDQRQPVDRRDHRQEAEIGR